MFLQPSSVSALVFLGVHIKVSLIIIMEICKVPTFRLKALNKHSITHIIYIEMEMLSAIKMHIRKGKKS